MPEVYECDGCGACCRCHIIEASRVDVLREPLIAERATMLNGNGKLPIEQTCWCLAPRVKDDGSVERACTFLDGNACTIYDKRPGVCVCFPAGGDQCQDARTHEGLERLKPLQVKRRDVTILHGIEEYIRRSTRDSPSAQRTNGDEP